VGLCERLKLMAVPNGSAFRAAVRGSCAKRNTKAIDAIAPLAPLVAPVGDAGV
jgi:hypothetical protein